MDRWGFSSQNGKKILQEVDHDNKDYAIQSGVEIDDEDDFKDKICWIMLSRFSNILHGLNIRCEGKLILYYVDVSMLM